MSAPHSSNALSIVRTAWQIGFCSNLISLVGIGDPHQEHDQRRIILHAGGLLVLIAGVEFNDLRFRCRSDAQRRDVVPQRRTLALEGLNESLMMTSVR